MAIVVDASVALVWCFPDETSVYADQVLAALDGIEMAVPAIWSVEIANAMAMAERRQRLHLSDIRRFTALLAGLSIQEYRIAPVEMIQDILPLTKEYGLSGYDASYLDIALRHAAPLATLDKKLQEAGRQAGIKIFNAI